MAPQTFEDDDFYDPHEDDYDEEQEELSPEDKVAMAEGTEKVKKALGADSAKVTAAQIQEALWHYYYDVDKSVAYLRKSFTPATPKPPPKKSAEGKFHEFSFPSTDLSCGGAANGAEAEYHALEQRQCSTSTYNEAIPAYPILHKPAVPASMFFSDMPWLDTPRERHANLVAPPPLPGGLLGGSDSAPKMSKLQALAAARKKRTDGKKEKEKASQTTEGLENLSISGQTQKENIKPASAPSAGLKRPNNVLQEPALSEPPSGSSHDKNEASSHTQVHQSPDVPMDNVAVAADQRAAPSAFAQTLVGSAPDAGQKQRRDIFAMPYTSSSSYFAGAFSEPSPDDVVLAAQAKAGKKSTPTTQKSTTKKLQNAGTTPKDDRKAEDISSSVSSLKISDAPAPKSKGLDVVKEFERSGAKRSASFVVVGHVDAGKSTLMGRLLLELKYVDQRTVDKYRRQAEKSGKQSFALAWVMDERSEERDRGVTIDIATNYFETDQTKFTILDAPGHRDFVPNMIAGASQADFAILVIDANTGAYEKGLKGQTREHVLLLRSLGLQRIIVAVNKLDMVGWSKDRFDEIAQEVTGFLTGLGFLDKNVDFVPISGLNGDNIAKKIEDPAAAWYEGRTLVEALEASEPTAIRALKRPFRMAISEVFRSQQGTTTLAGRIDAGTIQVGDVLAVQPSSETAYIKSIVVDKEGQEWAVSGQNVSIALTDIDPIHIRVGDILCKATEPIPCGDTFTMKAMAFEHLMPMPVDLHRGRLHAPGQIQSIAATLDKATGEIIKKKPKVVQPGGVARVRIKLNEKVPLEAGQRVVIRGGGETIAAGLLE